MSESKCEVCEEPVDSEYDLSGCEGCGLLFCTECENAEDADGNYCCECEPEDKEE